MLGCSSVTLSRPLSRVNSAGNASPSSSAAIGGSSSPASGRTPASGHANPSAAPSQAASAPMPYTPIHGAQAASGPVVWA